ncbi:disease resistance protein At4g27190-like [Eucalyptus grandis]|uniref:disease resistance protein At4g27190-like n=1 Tax=Eucalyptus grandis TaxID=71139 RepID=UPI00192E83D0|nr:disease resistance protein At4g27190-like [Eucalyptus grandis]
MREIKREVNRWKNDAETVANKACGMLDNEGRAEKTCFCGWLPNPKERYCLGRDARKTAQAIQALIPQGKFESVYYESAPPGRVTGTPDVNSSAGDGGDTIADSRASVFQGIMKALDDEKLRVIGVYGPGGVGKTTLLEEVEKKLRKVKGPFHMIVKAKVSQIPVSKNIQDEIADALKLDLKDVQSESGRANRLLERLQWDPSEKVLIILDDLWGELDLKAVGIPSKDMSGKCKLLLASRFKDVLEQKMLADRTFFLGGLNDDEAFRLFEKTVGDRLQGEEELKVIAAQVVKKLAGLPLLIISVASTLKNRGVSAWKNALTKIDVKKMETIVKLSYDHLESEDERSLFLLCGFIGGTISVEILLGLGMGLGFFEGYNKTIQSSRDRLNAMLESLHSICLLQDWGNDEDNVTIHDLYSEVVVSIPFRGQNSLMMNSNYGSWSKEKLENCWAICQVNAVSDGLTKLMTCQFPYLKILILSYFRDWWMNLCDEGDSCRLDFVRMKELQVLYLDSIGFTTLPSSIRILENLRSLYFTNCLLRDVAIIGKLKALQILSFECGLIPGFPKEIGELTNLRSLSLKKCIMHYAFEPNVLKGLINLEELYMRENSYQWMDEDEILSEGRLTELKSLTKLTSLEISIYGPTVLSMDGDLPFKNLNRFWIHIGIASISRELKGLRTMMLNLEGCNSILSKEWVQKTLQKTQYLCLEGLREFKKNACELCIQGFPQLKHLDIQNSPSIKYIASSSNSAFTILESLFLNYLINLEKICHGHIASKCFSQLKVVTVKDCNRLKYLWCSSQMQNLVHLEEIKVWTCDSILAIARKDMVPDDYRVELRYLRCLDLVKLPNMTSFCIGDEITSKGVPIQAKVVDGRGGDEGTESVTTTSDLQNTYSDSFFDGKVTFPNLRNLEIEGVPCKELWNDNVPADTIVSSQRILLENVKVKNCPSLKSLFDFGSLDLDTEQNAILLLELVRIDVERCPSLELLFNCGSLDSNAEHKIISLSKLETVRMKEVILEKEASRSEAEVMTFSCLSKLTLEDLDNLISFSSGSCPYYFSSLEDLRIVGCGNFGAFIPSPTSVKRRLGETVEEDESPQPLFNEMVTFPNLRNLEIEGVPCNELWNDNVLADSIVSSQQFLCKMSRLKTVHS